MLNERLHSVPVGHLPILTIVLAGTTAGAFIAKHWSVAALAMTGLFFLSVTRLLWAFMEK